MIHRKPVVRLSTATLGPPPPRFEDALCLYQGCKRRSGDNVPAKFPLCESHWELLARAAEEDRYRARRKSCVAQFTGDGSSLPSVPRRHAPVVYYVRFGDRIKIGTSTNLFNRLQSICHEALLAAEPGSYVEERQRHHQFNHLQVVGEWFTATPELLAHVEAVGAKHRIVDLVA